ncbi:MAG: potassium channel family protein [Culicoidibacterales bacterium]
MKKSKFALKNQNHKKQFVVVGLGMFGTAVAETLFDMDKEVLVIDMKEELIQSISDKVTHAIQADARDEYVLERLGIKNFDVGIVCIGNNLEASLIVTLAMKELGVKYIVAKANNKMHARALYKIGADRVVLPEEEMGKRVARNISATKLIDYIELSEEYSIFEFTCPDLWVDKTLEDLEVRKNYGVTILGVKRNGKWDILLEAQARFIADDIIILLGSKTEFQRQLESI